MYYVFERGMDRGAGGGRGCGRDSTTNERGLEREMNMMSRREIPLSVYMQGGRVYWHEENFLCVVSVLVCVGVRR